MTLVHAFSSRPSLAVLACLVGITASAQDVLTTVVPNANAVPGSALSTFGYDPTGPNGGTIYAAGFGASAEIRRIANVDGTQQVTQLVASSEWTSFLRNGDPNASGGQPISAGFLLNPTAVGGMPAYSSIVVTDGNTAITVSGTRRNDLTQRLYAYSLTTGSFSSLVTQAELVTAAGLANPVGSTTSNNVGRQYAYSGDGQAAYFADSTSAATFGGIYRANLAAGTVTRLLADTDTNTELAVLPAGGIDTILVRGGASTGNVGGIDRITFNGSTATPRAVHLSAARLADFMETSGTAIGTASMAADASGNVFFNNTTSTAPDRRAIFRLDPQGRLSKVASYAERKATLGSGTANINSNTLRLQPRSVQHPNGFAVTQLLYVESSPLNLVAGAYAFAAGDFDRDNDLDAADLALFRDAVTVRNGPAVTNGGYKFDLNGNDRADWKDVQVLGQFLDYRADAGLAGRTVPAQAIAADADLNGVVDFADFRILRTSFSGTAKSFVQGDFTGDNAVTLADLQAWVNTSGFRSSVVGGGVVATPHDAAEWSTFLASQTAPVVTLDVTAGRTTQFEAGYRSIVLADTVTKTGTGTLVLDGENAFAGTMAVAAGTVEIAHPSALVAATLRPASGSLVTLASGVAATLEGLDLTAGGRVDIGLGSLTVTSGSAEALMAALAAGRGDGNWTGPTGIVSSEAAAAVVAGVARGVGWVANGDGSVTVAFAAAGDVNIDGQLDILDAAGLLAGGRFDSGLPAVWGQGDANYDHMLDILDIGEFLSTGLFDDGPYLGSGAAPGITAVPEPSMGPLTAAAFAGGAACRWLRRRAPARAPVAAP